MATKSSSSSPSPSLFTSPLTINQLIDVLDLLKRCGFPQTRWHELGLRLGLHKNILDAIERNHPGDVSRCFTETLSKWLSRVDNVDSKGGATFDSLSDALKSMNENAAADKLDQENELFPKSDDTHSTVMNNECLAEEIKLADGEEQELRTLLDYKEGSIFEQDKQLNIIKKRKEYIERRLETPESKLKVKLLTRGKLINKIFKSKKSETEYFRTSLLMKAGTESTGIICLYYLMTGREEALVEYKKEIELLQENISITSVQLLMSEKGNIEKKDQWTQSPTAESIYTARIDYHGIWSYHLSFSEGEQLEIYEKRSSFVWKGRSLVSGDEGDITSSCVYSMLESLQLLEFILSVEEVSLPILQKTRNDSSSNDEKASLFLETINDDPIMISALRQDKEQHDKGVTGSVNWYSDSVYLISPSPVQCNEAITSTTHLLIVQYLYYHQLNCIH
uniref:Death domain-containing protein n=1 Tax=Amphimedon queenslandica TaxID=400682 RepID=A0A1X7T147_AMPQE